MSVWLLRSPRVNDLFARVTIGTLFTLL